MIMDVMSKEQINEVLLGDNRKLSEKITIAKIMESGAKAEYQPPIYVLLEYIISTLKAYKANIEKRGSMMGSVHMKELTYEDCSSLSSVTSVVQIILKCQLNQYLNLSLTNGAHKLDPDFKEILDILFDIIKENEKFNETKMQFQGSQVKEAEPKQQPRPSIDQNADPNYQVDPNVDRTSRA